MTSSIRRTPASLGLCRPPVSGLSSLQYGSFTRKARLAVWLALLPFWALPNNTSAQDGGSFVSSPKDVFQQVITHQKADDSALDLFERRERMESRHASGDKEPYETKVSRVFPAGTGNDKIPLTPDGSPPSAEAYRAALEKLESVLVWAAQDGPAQREAYAKVEKKRQERNQLIDATRNAFIFSPIGEEKRGDRILLKYEMTPNPAFKPASRNETLFTKVRGTLWVDKESLHLAKVEGYVTDDISLALFLARVNKGSYFMQERYEMAPGVWLPSFQQYDFDGRKFFRSFSVHERTFYQDYRRVGPPSEAVSVVRAELGKLPKSP